MPKLNVYKTSRIEVSQSDELKYLHLYYEYPTISKTINEVVVNHFEVIKECKRLKKRNKQLENANDILIEKIKMSVQDV